jgi:hypothetical protein
MTSTLKSFQAEIERISHVKHAEAIKQAKEAHAAAELAKHHGKKVVVKDESEAEVVEVDEGVTLEVSLGPAVYIRSQFIYHCHGSVGTWADDTGGNHIRGPGEGGQATITLSVLPI